MPANWKELMTVLIDKKGNANEISNFHPIAPMSCIYKLLMSIMANHLVNYAIDNELLLGFQKSTRPVEGCYEHMFLTQSLVLDAKQLQKKTFSWHGLISEMRLVVFHMM